MSFILDALRKAEHDRQLGSPSSMARLTQAPATIRPAPASLRPWLLLGLVLAMAVILVLALRRPEPEYQRPTPAAPLPAAPLANAAPASPTAFDARPAAPPERPDPVPPPAVEASTSPATAGWSSEPVEAGLAPPDGMQEMPNAATVSALDDDLLLDSLDDLVEPGVPAVATPAAAEPQDDADPDPAGVDEPGEIASTPTSPKAGTDDGQPPDPLAVLQDDGPHLLRDMPVEFRSSFPAVQVDVHVHDPDPQRRWILVQGRRYAQGDTLAQGTRVEAITADGTVLRWLDQSILIPLNR